MRSDLISQGCRALVVHNRFMITPSIGILVARKLATKPYFKWFHRIFLEDHVLFFVKECLVSGPSAGFVTDTVKREKHSLVESDVGIVSGRNYLDPCF